MESSNNIKTRCKRGHEFTEETTYIYIDVKGMEHRQCKVCKRNWAIENVYLKPGQEKDNKNHNTDKTHCHNGHEFTEENTYYYISGGRRKRSCRTCKGSPVVKRKSHLKLLGWTPELFDVVLKEQEQKCAICRVELTPTTGKRSGRTACADHEHTAPPKPRGVLCSHCNIGIGNLMDDPEIMRRAAEYIEKYNFESGGKPSGPQSLSS
jgi:hypothetical protein